MQILLSFQTGRGASDEAPNDREYVAQALANIRPVVAHPITVHTGSGMTIGMLGPTGPNAGYEVAGGLEDPRGLSVRLPGLELHVQTDSLRAQADAIGSRTLWFCRDGERVLLSTSQRALIALLGSFQLAQEAVGWFMVSGCAGPSLSWDARIRALAPAATLTVSKQRRVPDVVIHNPSFETTALGSEQRAGRLLGAIRAATEDLPRGPEVALSLSGGLDSRVLLSLVPERRSLRCFSWGSPDALDVAGTDAFVARQVAERLGAPFHFVPLVSVAVESVLDEYVAASEARVDHVGGYVDGMALWRALVTEHGVKIMLRGDEAFGWLPVLTESDVRRSVGAPELRDFGNRSWLLRAGFGDLTLPTLPPHLLRQRRESLATWRDRLYQQYRGPSILAALSAIKASYVETINPFTHDRVLSEVRGLPDRDRTDKRLFRRLAREHLDPTRVPFATTEGRQGFSPARVAELALVELRSKEAEEGLSATLRQRLLDAAQLASAPTQSASNRAHRRPLADAQRLPLLARRILRNTVMQEALALNKLLLRAVLISRAIRLFRADAASRAARSAA